MICRFCGNENNDSSVNCFICGKPLQSNIATSLVDIGGDGGAGSGAYAINNQNDPYANRFASDTGGGPSIGPQSFSAQIMAGETTKQSNGTGGVAIALLVIALLAALAWFLIFRNGAPFASLIGKGVTSATDAAGTLAEDGGAVIYAMRCAISAFI